MANNESVYRILVDTQGLEGAMRGLDDLTHRLGVTTAGLVALDTVAAQALVKYEYALARVSTVSQEVQKDTGKFQDGISKLAIELDHSTNKVEAANAAYEIASSGFEKQADILNILERSTKTAVAGFSDITTVSEAAMKVLNSYAASSKGLGETQQAMNRITNEAIVVQNLGIITVDQYAQQVGRVSAAAASAGISLEELNAYIAAATRNGVPARQAFTALQATIASIVTPSQQAIKESARIGVAFDAETLKARGLSHILNELASNTKKTAETQGLLFNSVEAFKGVSAVGGDNIAQFNEFLRKMEVAASGAGREVDKAYNIMAQTKQVKAIQAMNAISDALIELGKGVSIIIEPVAKAITFLTENFEALPEPIKQGVGMFLLLAGGASTLGLALVVTVGYIVGVTNSLRKVWQWLNGAKVSFNDLFDVLFNRNKEFVQTATLMNDMSNSTTSQLAIEERQVKLLKAAYDDLNQSKGGNTPPIPAPPGPDPNAYPSPIGPNPPPTSGGPIIAGPGPDPNAYPSPIGPILPASGLPHLQEIMSMEGVSDRLLRIEKALASTSVLHVLTPESAQSPDRSSALGAIDPSIFDYKDTDTVIGRKGKDIASAAVDLANQDQVGLMLAKRQGEIIGALAYSLDEASQAIYVDYLGAVEQGKGAGPALMTSALKLAEEQGRSLYLSPLDSAISFYRQYGLSFDDTGYMGIALEQIKVINEVGKLVPDAALMAAETAKLESALNQALSDLPNAPQLAATANAHYYKMAGLLSAASDELYDSLDAVHNQLGAAIEKYEFAFSEFHHTVARTLADLPALPEAKKVSAEKSMMRLGVPEVTPMYLEDHGNRLVLNIKETEVATAQLTGRWEEAGSLITGLSGDVDNQIRLLTELKKEALKTNKTLQATPEIAQSPAGQYAQFDASGQITPEAQRQLMEPGAAVALANNYIAALEDGAAKLEAAVPPLQAQAARFVESVWALPSSQMSSPPLERAFNEALDDLQEDPELLKEASQLSQDIQASLKELAAQSEAQLQALRDNLEEVNQTYRSIQFDAPDLDLASFEKTVGTLNESYDKLKEDRLFVQSYIAGLAEELDNAIFQYTDNALVFNELASEAAQAAPDLAEARAGRVNQAMSGLGLPGGEVPALGPATPMSITDIVQKTGEYVARLNFASELLEERIEPFANQLNSYEAAPAPFVLKPTPDPWEQKVLPEGKARPLLAPGSDGPTQGPALPLPTNDATPRIEALNEAWKKQNESSKQTFKAVVEDFQRLNQATSEYAATALDSSLALNTLNENVKKGQQRMREAVLEGYAPSSQALKDLADATAQNNSTTTVSVNKAVEARGAFGQLAQVVGGLVPASNKYTGALTQMGAGTASLVASMATQLSVMAAIAAAMWGVSKAVEHWDNIKTENANNNKNEDLEKTQALYSVTARTLERMAKGGAISAEQFKALNAALNGTTETVDPLQRGLGQTLNKLSGFNPILGGANSLFKAAGLDVSKMGVSTGKLATESNGLLKLQQQLNSTYLGTGDALDLVETRAKLSFAQLKVLYDEASKAAKLEYDTVKSKIGLLEAQKIPEQELLALKLQAANEYSAVITEQKTKELSLSRLSVEDRAAATKEIQQAQTEAAKAFDTYVTYLNKKALDQVLEYETKTRAVIDKTKAELDNVRANRKVTGEFNELEDLKVTTAATLALNAQKVASAEREDRARQAAYLKQRQRLFRGSAEMKSLDEARAAEVATSEKNILGILTESAAARLSLIDGTRDQELALIEAKLNGGFISEKAAAEATFDVRKKYLDKTYSSQYAALQADTKLRETRKSEELALTESSLLNESDKAFKLLAIKRRYANATFASSQELYAAEQQALRANLADSTQVYEQYFARLQSLSDAGKTFLSNALSSGSADQSLISGLESRIEKAKGNNRALKAIQDEFEKLGIRVNVFNTSEESVKKRTLLLEQARLKIEERKLALQAQQIQIETQLANLKSQGVVAEAQAKIDSGTLTPNQLKLERQKIDLEKAKMQAQTQSAAVSTKSLQDSSSLLRLDQIIAGANTDLNGAPLLNPRLEDVKVPALTTEANAVLGEIKNAQLASLTNGAELSALAKERNDLLRRIDANTRPAITPRQTGR